MVCLRYELFICIELASPSDGNTEGQLRMRKFDSVSYALLKSEQAKQTAMERGNVILYVGGWI